LGHSDADVLTHAVMDALLGAAAMGLITLVMSVYGFAVTFASSGINLAVTRMVAEAIGVNDCKKAVRSMRLCLAYAVFFGSLASVLLFFLSGYIGKNWLGDERTVSSLKFLAVSLTPIAVSSALSGYFTAVRRVTKSAFASAFEQAAKIFLTIYGLLIFAPRGIEYACLSVVGGASLAEFGSFFLSLCMYLHDKHKHLSGKAEAKKHPGLARYMFSITLPVALSSYFRSALITIEHMLIPRGLRKNGANANRALAAYGTLHGMALPLVLFPGAIPFSFASLIIPEVAERHAVGNDDSIRRVIEKVFKVTLSFSIGAAVVMYTFSNELGKLIYSSEEAGIYIRFLSPLVPVMYLDNAVDAVLKGMGKQLESMKINIADAALCVVLVYLLTPVIGLYGYIITIFVSELMNIALSIRKLSRISDFSVKPVEWVLVPFLISFSLCFFSASLTERILSSADQWATVIQIVFTVFLVAGGFFLCSFQRSDKKHKRKTT
ncbi:MAG: 2-C-methyl-D-erythritol 2,4-cyclodiphosphate synthase, partial [Clostridia bacterium]|nr:2-C-methyl-D-erythritol 2,4-cyclodiphosphate synthase [Clostridia bacterium]